MNADQTNGTATTDKAKHAAELSLTRASVLAFTTALLDAIDDELQSGVIEISFTRQADGRYRAQGSVKGERAN